MILMSVYMAITTVMVMQNARIRKEVSVVPVRRATMEMANTVQLENAQTLVVQKTNSVSVQLQSIVSANLDMQEIRLAIVLTSMSVLLKMTVTRSLIARIRQEVISVVVRAVLLVTESSVPKVIAMMETFAQKMK